MKPIKALVLASGCLLLGYLAGTARKTPFPGPVTSGSQAVAGERGTEPGGQRTRTPRYADLARNFSSMGAARKGAAMMAAVDHMDLPTIKRLLADAPDQANFFNYGETSLRAVLLQKWAEVDPLGLIEHGLAQNSMQRFEALDYAFAAMARVDIDATLARLAQMDPDTQDRLRFTVLSSLADTDPKRAFAMVLKLNSSEGEQYSRTIMNKWAMQDPVMAKEAFSSLPLGKMRDACLSSLMMAMADQDVVAAVAWAKGLPRAIEKANALTWAVNSLSRSDPSAALALLDENPSARSNDPWGGMQQIFVSMAMLDYDKTKETIQGLKTPAQRIQAMQALGGVCRKNHSDDLLAWAGQLPTAEAKALYLGNGWGAGDSATVGAWLEKIPEGPLRQQAKMHELWGLAYNDPEMAAKQLASLKPSTQESTGAIETIANRWASIDSDKALSWADDLQDFSQKKQALAQIYRELADADPAQSVAKLANISDPLIRDDVTAAVAGQWAMQDPEKALAWAKTLTGDQQTAAFRQIAQANMGTDPAQAQQVIALMVRNLSGEDWQKSENREIVGQMAASLAETDPHAAAKFADTLPVGDAQTDAYSKLVSAWSRYAPAEAEAWLGQMDGGTLRDQAAAQFVATVANSDPAKAYEWAASISDATERRKAAEIALKAWKTNGELPQARQALQDASVFTEQEIQELTKAIE
ncbi:MAG: hypothetical protein WCK77_05315 [Verrucomicrobiota bacterium]